MRTRDFNALNDLLFKFIFGHSLTEDIEIHFLELPKVTRQDIRSMRTLDKWMAFIGNKLSDEEMEAIAMSEAAIDTAWDRIEAFMRDAGQRRKYEQREKFEHDYVSDMEGSWKRGVSQGRQLGIAHMAMNMLRVGTPVATVAQMAELSEAVIRKMAEENGVDVL